MPSVLPMIRGALVPKPVFCVNHKAVFVFPKPSRSYYAMTACTDNDIVYAETMSGGTIISSPVYESLCEDCLNAQNAPSQTFGQDLGSCEGLSSDIKGPTQYNFGSLNSGGGYPVVWNFATNNGWALAIRCDNDGNVYARADFIGIILFGDGTGGTGGPNGGFRNITGEISCVGGQFSGFFRLYRNSVCIGGDVAYVLITF